MGDDVDGEGTTEGIVNRRAGFQAAKDPQCACDVASASDKERSGREEALSGVV